MADDELRYDQMVEDALRSVVRAALTRVESDGLPGEHHFYITFRTDAPGVDIPDTLKEDYPTEMTIVLQHQFWELKVELETFEVTLSFSNVPQRLVVPFDAIVSFADPSVRFGLQFDLEEDLGEEEGGEIPQDLESEDESGTGPQGTGKDLSAKVITLDSFRKK